MKPASLVDETGHFTIDLITPTTSPQHTNPTFSVGVREIPLNSIQCSGGNNAQALPTQRPTIPQSSGDGEGAGNSDSRHDHVCELHLYF
jgi:hypothetical protein